MFAGRKRRPLGAKVWTFSNFSLSLVSVLWGAPAQSDQESKLEAQGKFLELLLEDRAHLLTEIIQ